jgi:hypothetical protein
VVGYYDPELVHLVRRTSHAPVQADLFGSTAGFCDGRVAAESIYGLLHRECHRLFPDDMFADLFTEVGRRSVPPMIVAVVMVLQRIEGCSDREAVDRFCFDARWKYAAGGLDFDYPGFVHTVLVDMRARLAGSDAPNRIFDAVLEVAKAAGLVGRRRVLDSTPLYDAVATMDTVTLVRSAIRGLLKAAEAELEAELRAVLARDEDYASAGKPSCDYDDPDARVALVDALARDGMVVLAVLDGRELSEAVSQCPAASGWPSSTSRATRRSATCADSGFPACGGRRSPRSLRCTDRTRSRCSTATSRWRSGSPATGSPPAPPDALASVESCAPWLLSCRPRELCSPSCAPRSSRWCPRSG